MLHSLKSGFLFGGAGLFLCGGVQGVDLAIFVHTNRGFRRRLCRFRWTKIVNSEKRGWKCARSRVRNFQYSKWGIITVP